MVSELIDEFANTPSPQKWGGPWQECIAGVHPTKLSRTVYFMALIAAENEVEDKQVTVFR